MAKITGLEKPEELPEKVRAIYDSVLQAVEEGRDLSELTVSGITGRAGIGKGTAYDYFDSKEEIIACAVVFLMNQILTKLEAQLAAMDSLERQIDFLFDWVTGNFRERKCFYRFLHLLTDSAYIGQLIRQKTVEGGGRETRPMTLFRDIAQAAADRGEIPAEFGTDYVAYTICARLIALISYLHMESYREEELADLHRKLAQGLQRELCAGRRA